MRQSPQPRRRECGLTGKSTEVRFSGRAIAVGLDAGHRSISRLIFGDF